MRKIILGFLSFLLFVSCNSNKTNEQVEKDDTSSHTDHTSPIKMDSTDYSMMTSMHNMMTDMKAITSSGNPHIDFAKLMSAHHKAAVKMALTEKSQGKDSSVRALAEKMLMEQMQEITAFNMYLNEAPSHGTDTAFYKAAINSMDNMKMEMNQSSEVDKQFLQLMIPHHKSALAMAMAYLQHNGNDPAIKKIAQQILTSQQREIMLMNNMLKKMP